MANVPQITPEQVVQATTQPARSFASDYQHIDVSPNMFGAQIGVAEQGAGRELETAGTLVGEQAKALAGLRNETWAREQATNTLATLADAWAGYGTKRGQDAVNGYQDFIAQVQGVAKDAINNASNPQAREQLANALAPTTRHYIEAAASHRVEQTMKASIDASASGALQNTNQAMIFRNDPAKVEAYIAAGANEHDKIAELNGLDPVSRQQQVTRYRGQAYQQVIEGVALENPMAAQSMFSRVRGTLDAPSVVHIEEFLKTRVEDATADARFQQITGRGVLPGNANTNAVENGLIMQESGGHQFRPDGSPLISSAGAVGKWQVMPDTGAAMAKSLGIPFDLDRLKNDEGYNEMLGKQYLRTMGQQYGNTTLALAAYNAGPGRVDEWLQQNGDPRTGAISTADWVSKIPIKETRDYVQNISSQVAPQVAGGQTDARPFTSPDQLISRALEATKNDSPEVQRKTISHVSQYVHEMEAATAQQRADLLNRVSDMGPAALAGQSVTIPEREIRSLLPPQKADRIVNNLKLDAYAGQLFKGLWTATPQEIQQMGQDLVKGQGIFGEFLKGKGTKYTGDDEDVAPPGQATADFHTRNEVAKRFEQLVVDRDAALKADPVQYVGAHDPGVKAAWGDLQSLPSDASPEARQAAFDRFNGSLDAAQIRLNEPGVKSRILSQPMVQDIMTKISNIDPATKDVGPIVEQYAQTYGKWWPQAYSELVQHGHLSPQMQTVAWLDAPSQFAVRQDFIRAVGAASIEKGGSEGLEKSATVANPTGMKDLRANIGDRLAEFRNTMLVPGISTAANEAAYRNVQDSAMLLGSYYALQGRTGDIAQQVVDGMLGAKYDFASTYRTPKGMSGQVDGEIQRIENGMKAEDVMARPAIGGRENISYAQRQEALAQAPKTWINNDSDDGLIMVARLRDGATPIVLNSEGEPFQIKFAEFAKRLPVARDTSTFGTEAAGF